MSDRAIFTTAFVCTTVVVLFLLKVSAGDAPFSWTFAVFMSVIMAVPAMFIGSFIFILLLTALFRTLQFVDKYGLEILVILCISMIIGTIGFGALLLFK